LYSRKTILSDASSSSIYIDLSIIIITNECDIINVYTCLSLYKMSKMLPIFSLILVCFELCLRKLLGQSENVSNNVPTSNYNYLCHILPLQQKPNKKLVAVRACKNIIMCVNISGKRSETQKISVRPDSSHT